MADEIEENQRRLFLKDEYLFLQAQYEDYDRRSLQIKGWVTTGAVAALALSFNASNKVGASVLPIVVGTIVVTVWYLEARWKVFQYALSDRIRIIEAYFRNDPDIRSKRPQPFQIYHDWFESYQNDKPIYPYEETKGLRPRTRRQRMTEAAWQDFVFLPYLPILILCAVSLGVQLLSAYLSSGRQDYWFV